LIIHSGETYTGFPPIEPSFANIEPCDGDQVHGVVLDLTPEDFSVLWNGEGSGRWYATKSITITCYNGGISTFQQHLLVLLVFLAL